MNPVDVFEATNGWKSIADKQMVRFIIQRTSLSCIVFNIFYKNILYNKNNNNLFWNYELFSQFLK